MGANVRVEVWSDVACPWCWVGKRHLEQAIDAFEAEAQVEVIWRAFELDPAAPKEVDVSEVDYLDRLARKYRVSRGRAEAMVDRMVQVGAERGLDFRFDRARPGNTFDAHRLLHLAAEHGLQTQLKERFFQAYMHEGAAIGDPAVLADLADEVGLDADRVQSVLGSDTYTREVREEEGLAGSLGIGGVPFFVVGGKYAVSGAQPPETLLQALRRAAADIPEREDSVASGEDAACGPDGCALPDAAPG